MAITIWSPEALEKLKSTMIFSLIPIAPLEVLTDEIPPAAA